MLKPTTPPATALPHQPFFGLAPQRVRLARERYFDNGQRPTGLVPEPVIQSWARCLGAHQRPHDAVAFDPVSRSRMQAALARNRPLLLAAGEELQRLEATVGGTGCRVLLTDAEGVVVHATAGHGRSRELLPIVSRVGVNLAEAAVGTNAPAVVLKTGLACAVSGAEHFYDCVQRLHCAAAPIRDQQGALAGVLDLTVEARPFGFDASALVGIVATAIENRLLQEQAEQHLVLQFQVSASLLGSPLEALVGVDRMGCLVWANSTAQQLLGLNPQCTGLAEAESVFGQRLDSLLRLGHSQGAQACRLPNGLTVWMRAQGPGPRRQGPVMALGPAGAAAQVPAMPGLAHAFQVPAETGAAALAASAAATAARFDPTAASAAPAPASPETPAARHAGDGPPSGEDNGPGTTAAAAAAAAAMTLPGAAAAGSLAPAASPAPTLVDHQRELIDKVLADCAGNISLAARRLGVSRGLLYRRRRDTEQGHSPGTAGTGDEH